MHCSPANLHSCRRCKPCTHRCWWRLALGMKCRGGTACKRHWSQRRSGHCRSPRDKPARPCLWRRPPPHKILQVGRARRRRCRPRPRSCPRGKRTPNKGWPTSLRPKALAWSTWSAVSCRTPRTGELRSAPSWPDDWDRVAGKRALAPRVAPPLHLRLQRRRRQLDAVPEAPCDETPEEATVEGVWLPWGARPERSDGPATKVEGLPKEVARDDVHQAAHEPGGFFGGCTPLLCPPLPHARLSALARCASSVPLRWASRAPHREAQSSLRLSFRPCFFLLSQRTRICEPSAARTRRLGLAQRELAV